MHRSLAAAVALLAVVACTASGQTWQTLVVSRQRHGERALRVDVEYGAGELSIRPGSPGTLYHAELRYDADRSEPRREFRQDGGVGTLRLGLRSKDGFSLRGLKRKAGSLSLRLAPDIPLGLDLDFGAGEADIELGGMRITALSVNTGASDATVRFSQPNGATIERCFFNAGVAAFRVEGLGNARCAKLDFDGGVGYLTLDFGGVWAGDMVVDVSMGIGSLTLRVPEAVGVTIEKDTFLTSFSAAGMVRQGKRWVSENWAEATHKLTISINAALGSVDVERTR